MIGAQLRVENLNKSWSGRLILHNITFTLKSCQLLALLGANGAGKSTLLRMMAGILKASAGQIFLNNIKLQQIPRKKFAQNVIYVPQENLRPAGLSVQDMILQGRFPWLAFSGLYSTKDKMLCKKALARTGLDQKSSQEVSSLSGGEWQMALLARALCQAAGAEAPVFLLDEISSGLDPAKAIAIFGILRQLKNSGMAVLVSVHDYNLAAMFASHIIAIKNGGVLFYGKTENVFTAHNLSRLYDLEMESFRHPDLGCPQVFPRFRDPDGSSAFIFPPNMPGA